MARARCCTSLRRCTALIPAGRGTKGDVIFQELSRLCEDGRLEEALDEVQVLARQGVPVNSHILHRVLEGCIEFKCLAAGRRLHALVWEKGFSWNVVLGNKLLGLFASCGSLSEAYQVFQGLPQADTYTWQAIISAHVRHGQGKDAIRLYHEMQRSSLKPNAYVYVAVLRACVSSAALREGRVIHSHLKESGLEGNPFVGSILIDMYAKCGSLDEAREVFDRLPDKDLVTWNTMLGAYAHCGEGEKALHVYVRMQQEGYLPNRVTILAVIKACGSVGDLHQAKLLHASLVAAGLMSDVVLANAAVVMYARCGSLLDARQFFDNTPNKDVVSWTAMIAGCAQHGHCQEALQLFHQMCEEGLRPNKVTYISILKACGSVAEGRLIHDILMATGFEQDTAVGSALVDMYAKLGDLDAARHVFDNLTEKSLVSWNVIIGGYTQQGKGEQALQLFEQMQREGVEPDRVTILSLLKACGSVAALAHGRLIHGQLTGRGLEADVAIGNTLVDMYSKCGSVDEARRVFDKMPEKNVVSWNAMMGGCAQHGQGEEALQLFQQMLQEGLKPEDVSLVCVLSACSHAGLLAEGYRFFVSMFKDFGITPGTRHYVCMVDLLGRAGHLLEAETLIKQMPWEPEPIVWKSLLGACQIHGNVDLGRRCMENLVDLEPTDCAAYVLMSNIYTKAGMWQEGLDVRNRMRISGLKKTPGKTWLEVENCVHIFQSDDVQHPERKQIYSKLQTLVKSFETVCKDR